MMTPLTYFLILLGATLTAFGGVWLKRGATAIVLDDGIWSLARTAIFNFPLIFGLVCYVSPIGIWIYLMRTYELSKLQPLLAIVYVITPIFAIIYFQESVSLMRWGGIFFIIIGVGLVSQS